MTRFTAVAMLSSQLFDMSLYQSSFEARCSTPFENFMSVSWQNVDIDLAHRHLQPFDKLVCCLTDELKIVYPTTRRMAHSSSLLMPRGLCFDNPLSD